MSIMTVRTKLGHKPDDYHGQKFAFDNHFVFLLHQTGIVEYKFGRVKMRLFVFQFELQH